MGITTDNPSSYVVHEKINCAEITLKYGGGGFGPPEQVKANSGMMRRMIPHGISCETFSKTSLHSLQVHCLEAVLSFMSMWRTTLAQQPTILMSNNNWPKIHKIVDTDNCSRHFH